MSHCWSWICRIQNFTLLIRGSRENWQQKKLASGAEIELNNRNLVNNTGGLLTNNGSVQIKDLINHTGGTIDNTGAINTNHDINNNGGTVINTGTISVANAFTNNSSGTVNNAGTININEELKNYGLITNEINGSINIIDPTTGYARLFNYSSGTIENSGTIGVELAGTNQGTIHNLSSGNFFFTSGELTGDGSIINDGTFSVSHMWGGGHIDNNGIFTFTGSQTYRGSGSTINNSGTMVNNGSSRLFGDINLTNSGTFNNNSRLKNYGYSENTATGIFNNNNYYWQGNSAINNAGTINNSGEIEISHGLINDNMVNNYGFLGYNGYANNDIVNNSIFNNASGAEIELNNRNLVNNTGGLLTNNGSVQIKDLINHTGGAVINDGEIVNSGSFNNYGTYSGSGTFTGEFTNYGTLGPGSSPGNMTIHGDLNFYSGLLEIDIGGTLENSYDQLFVDGSAYLTSGGFNFSQWSDFDLEAAIAPGDSFEWEFLHADLKIYGATVNDPLDIDDFLIDFDLLPAGFDYSVFMDDAGTGLWLSVTNETNQPPVPEPTTMLLFITGLIGFAGIRRKKTKK